MKKIFCFDIDGTLAPDTQPLGIDIIKSLQILSNKYILILASGKPSNYIYGIIKQCGIKQDNLIIIGENGGTIDVGDKFPTNKSFSFSNALILQQYSKVIQKVQEKYTIWLQPNQINLSIFPINIDKDYNGILNIMKDNKIKEVNIIEHWNAIDYVPINVNKYNGILKALELINLDRKKCELYCFGDGNNDIEMLDNADKAFVVGNKISIDNAKYLKDYLEVAKTVENIIKEMKSKD